jgi:rhodanese-related sulfurtransferase
MASDPIEPLDAHAQLVNGEAVLVDVREPDAFQAAHPEGAINIPIGELADRLGELPEGVQVITSCGGGTRGPKAAAQLQELGIDARVVKGGLRGWTGAELPVATDG